MRTPGIPERSPDYDRYLGGHETSGIRESSSQPEDLDFLGEILATVYTHPEIIEIATQFPDRFSEISAQAGWSELIASDPILAEQVNEALRIGENV
jgi:hypothetical protein